MERTYAAQVRGADEIKVCGFVENIRNKSKMAFIVLKGYYRQGADHRGKGRGRGAG